MVKVVAVLVLMLLVSEGAGAEVEGNDGHEDGNKDEKEGRC